MSYSPKCCWKGEERSGLGTVQCSFWGRLILLAEILASNKSALCRIANFAFSFKARSNQSVSFMRWADFRFQRILLKWIGLMYVVYISPLLPRFFSRFLRPALPGERTFPLQLPTTKTSLKKWIGDASNFIALIPSRSIRQILANCFGVEFQRTLSKFRKRKRKLLCCVPCLDKTSN